MRAGIFISAIIAPALFWIFYFYYKDRFKPEPVRYLGISYLYGLVSAFACIKFFAFLPFVGIPEDPSALMEGHRVQFFFYSLGVIGLAEELFKLLPFLLIVSKFKYFDEKIDGIIYASLIALGFASYENMLYLAHLDGFELFGRAFASPLTHTIFSSIWGYMVGLARLKNKSVIKASLKGVFIAAFFHGIFDFFTTSPSLRMAASITILFIWIWQIRTIEKLRRKKC